MDEFDLLAAVQPAGGWTAIIGLRDGKPRQLMLQGDDVKKQIALMEGYGRDVYFGVAKYADPTAKKPRAKDNVLALRSFWIDIDAGADKLHKTQAEALKALMKFVKALGLPVPIIVDSGYGLHVYWPLSEDISRAQWEPVAAVLRDAAVAHGIGADPTCFEVARILRVPGTTNRKNNMEVPVTVILTGGKVVSYAAFAAILNATPVPASARPKGNTAIFGAARGASTSAMTQALVAGAKTESFDYIMRRKGTKGECRQLTACYEERKTLLEPRWWAGLSIAQKCVDRDTAIHKLSKGYPKYDPAETERKANGTGGPFTCAYFELHNPGGCTDCKWQGLITSPIELGHERPDDEPVAEVATLTVPDKQWLLQDFLDRKLPAKYEWRDNGTIVTTVDDKGKKVIVSPIPLVVVKHLKDPEGAHYMVLKALKEQDGCITFLLPGSATRSPGDLDGALADAGVFIDIGQAVHLQKYLKAANRRTSKTKETSVMRTQFGWADNANKFVLGHWEYSAGVPRTAADLSDDLRVLADKMVPTGTMAKWQQVMSLYKAPGMEPHAFAAATAFGAPLLKFSGLDGALLNLVHPDSGTGKTTVLRVCNSIWGEPKGLLSVKGDSLVTRVQKLGYFCNLPYCVDEMTNAEPEHVSEFSYSVTQGVGKDRMLASANRLRANTTRWQTMALCSANRSFYDKLESFKAAPEGERMRIIEYVIDPNGLYDAKVAADMFDTQLQENFGHVGPLYAQWLVDNRALATAIFNKHRDRIYAKLNLHQSERFWALAVAANLAGAEIAIQNGWVDWDLKAIRRWAYALILSLRTDRPAPTMGPVEHLNDFINLNLQNILVVDAKIDLRRYKPKKGEPAQPMGGMQALGTHIPRGDLRARYEPNTKSLFVLCQAFREYCSRKELGYRGIVNKMVETGLCKADANGRADVAKHISRGMPDVGNIGGTVRVLHINTSHPDFIGAGIDLDTMIAAAADEEPEAPADGD